MTGMYATVTGNYARAVAAGIVCGLSGIPIIDAFAHATGKGHGAFSSLDFVLTFIAFVTILLTLNFVAGVISHAVAAKPVRHPAEAAALGFVAGVALLLTEISVFGIRIVSDTMSRLSMDGTGSDVLIVDIFFILLLALLVVPGSAVNGTFGALGSLGLWQAETSKAGT